jgi:hypothetical protein
MPTIDRMEIHYRSLTFVFRHVVYVIRIIPKFDHGAFGYFSLTDGVFDFMGFVV